MLKYLIFVFTLFIGFASHALANSTLNNVHILYYENIEFEKDPYEILNGVPFKNFKDHLALFKSEAYEVIDFKKLNQLSVNPSGNPKKYIIIILNSNNQAALKYALPLLKRYGYPIEFSVKLDDFIHKSDLNLKNKNTILNLNIKDKNIDIITKNLNDETSRFRDNFGKNSNILMVDDFIYNSKIKSLLSRYTFDKILIPKNESNEVSNKSIFYSYMNIGSIFTNIDVMNAYLNRRVLPHDNLTLNHTLDTTTNQRKVSWGMTLPDTINNNSLNELICIDSNNHKSSLFILENRVEIRHAVDEGLPSITVHCTLPIYDKNNNISNSYHYLVLHEIF